MKSLKETLLDHNYEVPDKTIFLGALGKDAKILYDADWKTTSGALSAKFTDQEWERMRDYITADQKCRKSPYIMRTYKYEDYGGGQSGFIYTYCSRTYVFDPLQKYIYSITMSYTPFRYIVISKSEDSAEARRLEQKYTNMLEFDKPEQFPIKEEFVMLLNYIWEDKFMK